METQPQSGIRPRDTSISKSPPSSAPFWELINPPLRKMKISYFAIAALLSSCALNNKSMEYAFESFDECMVIQKYEKLPISVKFSVKDSNDKSIVYEGVFRKENQTIGPLKLKSIYAMPYSLGDPIKGPLAPGVITVAKFQYLNNKPMIIEVTESKRKPTNLSMDK